MPRPGSAEPTADATTGLPRRFAHLHQHTQFSLLDGAARLKDLLKWVKESSPGDPALAMTDHGNLHGAVQFYKYATELGVKPIIGYEAYVAAGSRRDRRVEKGTDGGYSHLTLLARDMSGYRSLCRLASIAYLEGYYYKPRIDHEALEQHHQGLIAMSGCLGAEVPQLILNDRLDQAEARLLWYQNLFGDNYYVEIQDHGLPEQKKVNPVLRELASRHGIAMVATNDGHYVRAKDAFAHETLLAIQTKANMADENRFRFPCNEFYVKTLDEMRVALPPADWGDEVFDNTARVADACELDLPIGSRRVYQMPQLPIPEGRTMPEELRAQVYRGLTERYPEHATLELYRAYVRESLEQLPAEARERLLARLPGPDPARAVLEDLSVAMAFMGSTWTELSESAGDKYTTYPGLDRLEQLEAERPRFGHGLVILRRAEYESGVIVRMGFPDYFLIVADFINWAKAQGISVGPGRGSGAASMVAYALRITNLDPLAYGLLFERFLNPDRISMPDFDVDFSDSRRGEVIEYVRSRYGDDKVAMIATFGTMASKAVLKDVARVMSLPFGQADKLSKLIPVKFGRSISLEESARTVPDIARELEASPEARKVFETALSLEGLTRHASIHASGVIIGRERLDELVPLMRDASGEGVVCQLDMASVEDIGLIKMDFLGLRTLSFLEEAIRIVRESKGVRLDPDAFPIDDPATFDLLSRGETKGVFQLEGGGITDASRKLKPRRIQDIIALSALYRPGPMENIPTYIERHHGREQVRYDQGAFDLPSCERFLEPILRETYGIPVYQEQIVQIASAVAGYSLGEADLLRRAMGKKKLDEMARERQKFQDGAARLNSIPQDEANRLFDLLEAFANYGFNKAHSAAYAFISFQTAYLKAHYPVEFMAALLTVERRDSDKVAEYIQDARQIELPSGGRIEVLPPDINLSTADFTVAGERILFGLFAVKNLGDGQVSAILEERRRAGPYRSLPDLCSRLQSTNLNRRGIESLVKAGALDAFGPRDALLESVEDAVAYADGQADIRSQGMDALFGLATLAPEPPVRIVPAALSDEQARERAISRLRDEKDAVGLYVTGHPLEHYPGLLEAASTGVARIAAWSRESSSQAGYKGRKRCVLAGMIENVQRKPTRSGGMMARFNLTDQSGTAELVAFSRAYDRVSDKLIEDAPALVIAEIEPDGESLRVTCDEIISFEDAQSLPKLLWAELDLARVTPEQLETLDEVLHNQDGLATVPIRVKLIADDSFEVWDLKARAAAGTVDALRQACPWLRTTLAVNGDAVLARLAPRPWENRDRQASLAQASD